MKIIQTSLLLWAHGMALTPTVVLLRPERAGDQALIAHEKRHCEQMREFGTFTYWRRYLCDREFRLEMELEAYRVQLALQPCKLDAFAKALATRYLLNSTQERMRDLLLEPPPAKRSTAP